MATQMMEVTATLVPDDDEDRASELLPELCAVAVEGALGVGHREEQAAQRRLREQARVSRPATPPCAWMTPRGVVHVPEDAGPLVEDHHRAPRDAAGDHAHYPCTRPAACIVHTKTVNFTPRKKRQSNCTACVNHTRLSFE
jgi:hypothetical protein